MVKRNSTKAKIVEVAWKLFEENGYDETTLDEIIAASNTSKGSFYHYFNGKDELLATLSEILDSKYEEIMNTVSPDMNSYDKLLYLCCNVHDMIQESIPVRLLASLYSSQVITKGDKHLLDQNRYYYRIVNQITDEGQRRGQIINTMPYYDVANLYIMCERAIIYDYCINDGTYDLGEITRKYMPMMFGCVKVSQPSEIND